MIDHRWRRVLITGAAGRIGSTLRAGLIGRHDGFRLLDRKPVTDPRADEEVIVGDIEDRAVCVRAVEGVDAMIHLAGAPDATNFDQMFDVNARGMYNIFEAARKAGVRRIAFASTNHTYGMYPVEHGMTEHDQERPDSFYGVTKVFAEVMLRYYWDKHGIESVSVRIGSFEKRPSVQRHLMTWFSHGDTVELFDRALKQPEVGHTIVFGMSNNKRLKIKHPNWEAIGFKPTDDAESWVEQLKKEGVDVDGPLEWKLHGGMYEPPEY